MPVSLMNAFSTLSLQRQAVVENLIYFLVSQQNAEENNESKVMEAETLVDSLIGTSHAWNGEDALEYQKKLRNESRV